jgi:hypothetical protein
MADFIASTPPTNSPEPDPIVVKLRELVWDAIDQLPCQPSDFAVLHKILAITRNGHASEPAPVEIKTKAPRTFKRNKMRPFIDHVLQFHDHPTGRFTQEEILAGLRKTDCELARDDKVNFKSIRGVVVKFSQYYTYDKIEKTFSLKKPLLKDPLVPPKP